MLRIGEKHKIFLWKRESIFSFDILKGLTLALGIHLVLFFGLRIASPPNCDSLSPISPVDVEIDLGTPQALSPTVPISFFPLEQIDTPRLLEMPETILVVESPSYRKAGIHEPDFSEIEKISYEFLEDLDD